MKTLTLLGILLIIWGQATGLIWMATLLYNLYSYGVADFIFFPDINYWPVIVIFFLLIVASLMREPKKDMPL